MTRLRAMTAMFAAVGHAAAAAVAPVLAIDADFPDPNVLRAPDGWYYAYATQGEQEGLTRNIQIARSRDLKRWQVQGDALPAKPLWTSQTQEFWAPHVVAHEGRYLMYYSAKPDAAVTDTRMGLCLAVATSRLPQGPFVDIGHPLQCGSGFVNIDPMAFDDPKTGKRLLYWGSGFAPIKVRELAADRVSFTPGSSPHDVMAPRPNASAKNYGRLVEGAWMTRHAHRYYLFYSGDNCCGPNAHYATLVAGSASAFGPFVTLPGQVLAADARWLAPGHNAVIDDREGRTWTFYHAIDRTRTRTSATAGVNTRRVMLMRELVWRNGRPEPR